MTENTTPSLSRTAHWRPMANAVQAGSPFVLTSGEGSWVVDTHGRRYLDATAALWFCQVGFGRREIADAMYAQSLRLPAYHTFGDYSNEPAIELAERISELAPGDGWKVFFTSGGSDSTDTAVKLVRQYWQVSGQATRTVVLSRRDAYHGMHLGATTVTGMDVMREGYGPLLPDAEQVDRDDAADLERAIQRLGAERVAAFFCEPVMGAGGMHFPKDDYLRQVREICRRHGVLFVVDEVVTGFGRAGDWFASRRFDLDPDMILCAKGITSGYAPLGAVLVGDRVAAPFWDVRQTVVFKHGYTYSGHATAAAAALANLDYIDEHGLLAAGRHIENCLPELLAPLAEIPLVDSIRTGPAALGAIQFDPERCSDDPALAGRAVLALREVGLLTRPLVCGAVQVSPALTITDSELDQMAALFERGLRNLN